MTKIFTKHSDALTQVKKLLPKTTRDSVYDTSPFICDNINTLHRKGSITESMKIELKQNISTKLDNAFSLSSWLCRNGHATDADIVMDKDGKKLQRTRQLWLDDMIAEYKAKGM